MTSQGQYGLNKVKASAFRRWPVLSPYRDVQTTRLTGGHDSEGYYVSTVGLNEATIRKYIQEQEKHDIALDKLSVKEYEDPFKGSR